MKIEWRDQREAERERKRERGGRRGTRYDSIFIIRDDICMDFYQAEVTVRRIMWAFLERFLSTFSGC